MRIPFGKPFPGIDPTSLRDGVAAGLVNGYINELDNYQIVPGLTEFSTVTPVVEVTGARLFDGVDDRLDTGLHICKGATQAQSIYAWVKQPGYIQLSTIFGCVEFGGVRYQFRVENIAPGGIDKLAIQMLAPFGEISCETLTGVSTVNRAVFVAFVNDVGANRGRLFWGFTPDTVVEVSTSEFLFGTTAITTFTNPTNPFTTTHIGCAGRENLTDTNRNHFTGIIDSVGVEYDTILSLAQLKDRARCGLNAQQYHWPINGTDPEPGITIIYGTTPVPSICGGDP